MKKINFRASKKLLLVGGIAALGLAAAAFLYFKNNAIPTPPPTDQPVGEKATTGNEQDSTSEEGDPKTAPPKAEKEDTQTPAPPSFTLTLTRAGQTHAGGSVQIRALVSGATSGTCQVTFSGPGNSFTKTSAISFDDGRTYTCGALNAAASEFSASGNWNFSLKATSGSKVSNTVKGQVAVTK